MAAPIGTTVTDPGNPQYVYQQEAGGYRILSSPNSGGVGTFVPEGKYPTLDALFSGGSAGGGSAGAGNFFNQIGSWLGNKNATGTTNAATVANIAAQYGPGAVDAVGQLFSKKNRSSAQLTSDLAKLQAKFATTTNPTKKIQYAYEIQGLKSLIAQVQLVESGARQDLQQPSAAQNYQIQPNQANSVPVGFAAVGLIAVLMIGGLVVIMSRK